jgi:hypothetical protein
MLLALQVQRTGNSFKAVLNAAVRRAYGPQPSAVKVEPAFPAPFPANVNLRHLADEWEDGDTLRELSA